MSTFCGFSTSEVFGKYAYKVAEGDATSLGAVGEARWTYAVSKLATEHLALSYHKQYELPTVSIRPFNIFGPRQVGEGAVHHFISRAIRNEPLTIHGEGSQIRSWCYVDDIVDGVLETLVNENSLGHAFNIGNPRSTLTIYHLAKLIVQLAGSKSEVLFTPMDRTDVELRIPNIDKAKALLGYEPKVNLEEGLLRTIDWYIAHNCEAGLTKQRPSSRMGAARHRRSALCRAASKRRRTTDKKRCAEAHLFFIHSTRKLFEFLVGVECSAAFDFIFVVDFTNTLEGRQSTIAVEVAVRTCGELGLRPSPADS